MLISSYKALGGQQDEKGLGMVTNVAACLELLQSFFIIEDDIVDEGINRRGKPCWHRLVIFPFRFIKYIIINEILLLNVSHIFLQVFIFMLKKINHGTIYVLFGPAANYIFDNL